MPVQMFRKIGKTAESAVTQVMFEALDIGKMIAIVQAHQLKQFGQHGVTFANFFGHPGAFGRQGETAIRLISEKTEFSEPLHHDGSAGSVQLQSLGDIGNTGVALAILEIENALEIVLHALGYDRAVMGAPFAGTRTGWCREGFRRRPSHEKSY